MRRRQAVNSEVGQPGPRSGWIVPWLGLGLSILCVIAVLVLLGLSGRSIPIPGFLVDRIEARANRGLEGRAELNIARADLVVGAGFVPLIRLADVTLKNAHGQRLATIGDLRGSFQPESFLRGEIRPTAFAVRGARLAIRRLADGTLDVAPGVTSFSGTTRRPADILDDIDKTLQSPALAELRAIRVEGLAILFDDQRADQIWTVRDGAFDLERQSDGIAMTLGFDLYGDASLHAGGAGDPPRPGALGRAQFTIKTQSASSAASLDMSLSGISARDLAAQVPALAWLGALDAPISGSVTTGLGNTGDIAPMSARLTIGSGALKPTRDTAPVTFNSVQLEVGFDPESAALQLSRLEIDSPTMQAKAAGKAWLKEFSGGLPEQLVGQLQLSHFSANPVNAFDRTVTIGEGLADIKIDLDPFRITIGQLVLVDQGRRISARGKIAAEPQGWSVALDVGIDSILSDRLLALWPVRAVPKTRAWLATNVAAAELLDVKGAMRIEPGKEPKLALGYRFRGASVRFLKTLPPISDGSGYASINDYTYTLVAEAGHIRAPIGGDIDVSGSVLKVVDLRAKPTRGQITLYCRGSLLATLAILDEPPFRFLTKAGKPVALADGMAELTARLELPLTKKLRLEDISYEVTGVLKDVRSEDRLVPGRTLAAELLDVKATRQGLTISGKAALDGVALDGSWTKSFDPADKDKSVAEADVELSMDALRIFGISLPDGAVRGRGKGRVTLELIRAQVPSLVLTSDLAGLGLAIPQIGWDKPPDQSGNLVVEAGLGSPPTVGRLDMEAAGMKARAGLFLDPEGGLERIELPGLEIGAWFAGDVTLKGRGKGRAVGVEVTSGTLDLRRSDLGGGDAGEGEGAPITVTLDRLQITDDISLTGFRGSFDSTGGMAGSFSGLVNGRAPVSGGMSPAANGGSKFRIEADDAGAALLAAGIYESGRGGRLVLDLAPGNAARTYEGVANIRSIRIVDAPALAGLLNAISVVGLLTQLEGPGILFTDVEGRFLLTPDAIEISQGSAIGPSLGVSAAGVYRSAERALDFQGVISPIYLLNGVGQIFSRQRDGFFGFSYQMTGTRERTSVTVNPLSILTPGLFREMFRKDPPKLSQ